MKKRISPGKSPASGIDISSCNSGIDWRAIEENKNISFVIIRLSLGYGTIDPRAYEYAAAAKNAGKKISYYHFAYPDPKTGDDTDILIDAAKEANYFKLLLGDLARKGFKHDFMPAIDLEDDLHYKSTRHLDAEEYGDWLTTFFSHFPVSEYGRIMIYGSSSYLDARLPENHKFGGNPLWIANYGVLKPKLPNGWESFYLWQYGTGKLDGIAGEFDFDRMV